MATIQDITYAITKVDTDIGRIYVNYKTPIVTQGLTYPIDLPIADDGVLPTGEELQALIMQNAPVGQLTDQELVQQWEADRKAAAAKANFGAIEALVVSAPISNDQPTVSGAQTL